MNPLQHQTVPVFAFLSVWTLISMTSMFANISLPNERSRAYLAQAIVDHQTYAIDKPLRMHGMIGDRAKYKGIHYSDKAPGTGYAGALVYWVAKFFLPEHNWTITELLKLFRAFLVVPISLIGFLILRATLRSHNLETSVIDLTSVTWILGSAAFHYSGAFFGHQLAATFLICAYFWLRRALIDSTASNRAYFCSGLFCGFAVLIEYPAAIGVSCLGILLLLYLPKVRMNLFLWCAGGAPSLLLLLHYHDTCFGHPLSLPYEHLAASVYQKIHSSGIAGVTLPSTKELIFWLLHPRRGLLFTTPIYGLSLVGCILLWRQSWRIGIAFSLLIGLVICFVGGAHIWGGDWGYGPRILVFSLGLLTIPTAVGANALCKRIAFRYLVLALCSYSIILHQLVHFFFPEPWAKSVNPVWDILQPMWRSKTCSPNMMTRHFGWSCETALLMVMFLTLAGLIYLMLRMNLQNRLLGIAFTILLPLGLIGSHRLLDTSRETTQKEWIKLIHLWDAREDGHHRP